MQMGLIKGFVGGVGRRLIVWLRSLDRAGWGAGSFARRMG
jgi:hypothetical protein